ncbi:hypothetical protein CsatA_006743 [Cannabis sativa]
MPQADDRSMYLGLPSTIGCNKSAVLGFLKDRVRKNFKVGTQKSYLELVNKC